MWNEWPYLISSFGESALLLPLSVVLALALAIRLSVGTALAWILSLGLCLGLIAALKVLGYSCGQFWFGRVVSQSGHVAFSTAFYGALGVMVAWGRGLAWLRIAVVVVVGALVVAIAVSRNLVGVHSVGEIVGGFLVGGLALALFARGYLRVAGSAPATGHKATAALAAIALLLMIALWGRQLDAERAINALSLSIRQHVDVCD